MAPTNPPTAPSSPPPSTLHTIAIFTQLKRIAETGFKLNPDLYYTHPGYAEHAIQFGAREYALLTDGQERPDLEWERACQIYRARKNIPRELVDLPRVGADPRRNKYVMAGVPFERVMDKDGNGLIPSVEKKADHHQEGQEGRDGEEAGAEEESSTPLSVSTMGPKTP